MRTIDEIYASHKSRPVTLLDESYTLVEWELQSEKEQLALWHHLHDLGVDPWEIRQFNFQGNDGKFHRTTHIYI